MTITNMAKGAATCTATKTAVRAALEAQIKELKTKLAGYEARDIADEMTDNRYYSSGAHRQAYIRISNTKAEIDLLEKALDEVFHE